MTTCEKCMHSAHPRGACTTPSMFGCRECGPDLLEHVLEISPNPDFPWDHKRWYGECSCHNPDGLGVGRMDFTGDTWDEILELHEEHLWGLREV